MSKKAETMINQLLEIQRQMGSSEFMPSELMKLSRKDLEAIESNLDALRSVMFDKAVEVSRIRSSKGVKPQIQRTARRNGTAFLAYLEATEEQLTELLGQPSGPFDKVTKEWAFIVDGSLFTIYDYKGHEWHVGGTDHNQLWKLEKLGLKVSK